MRFLARAATGFAIFALAIAALAIGLRPYWGCAPGLAAVAPAACPFAEAESAPPSERVERTYIVRVETLRAETVAPTTAAFGEIAAGRRLELRAAAAGRVVETGPSFRDGGRVAANELLFRLDARDLLSARDSATAARAEAAVDRTDALEAVAVAEAEHRSAIETLRLRRRAFMRQNSLLERGLTAATDVDAAEIAVADADRSVIAQDGARRAAAQRLLQAEQALARADLTLADAERALENVEVRAPFAGVLADVDATEGRLVADNEALGSLFDPRTLEVAFRLPNRRFAALLDLDGRLLSAPVVATLDLGARALTTAGRLDRVAGAVDMASGGRLLYAVLDAAAETALRPGDFVSVEIREPDIADVAIVPAAALGLSESLLVLGDDGRLRAAPVSVVRREGAEVYVRDAPIGARYVVAPTPELGPGVKARAEGDPEAETERSDDGGQAEARSVADREARASAASAPMSR